MPPSCGGPGGQAGRPENQQVSLHSAHATMQQTFIETSVFAAGVKRQSSGSAARVQLSGVLMTRFRHSRTTQFGRAFGKNRTPLWQIPTRPGRKTSAHPTDSSVIPTPPSAVCPPQRSAPVRVGDPHRPALRKMEEPPNMVGPCGHLAHQLGPAFFCAFSPDASCYFGIIAQNQLE